MWFFVVRLSSTNSNVTFRGFIIQAVTQPENDIVGSFIIVDNETRVQECHLSAEDPISPTVSILMLVFEWPNHKVPARIHKRAPYLVNRILPVLCVVEMPHVMVYREQSHIPHVPTSLLLHCNG